MFGTLIHLTGFNHHRRCMESRSLLTLIKRGIGRHRKLDFFYIETYYTLIYLEHVSRLKLKEWYDPYTHPTISEIRA